MTGVDFRPPIRHPGGICGERIRCHRSECRDRYGDMRTVELVDGRAYAFCHGLVVSVDPVLLRRLAA